MAFKSLDLEIGLSFKNTYYKILIVLNSFYLLVYEWFYLYIFKFNILQVLENHDFIEFACQAGTHFMQLIYIVM